MKNILVPVDFSDCSLNALDCAVNIARTMKASLTVIHAIDASGSIYISQDGSARAFTEKVLEDARQKLGDIQKSINETEQLSITTNVLPGALSEAIKNSIRTYSIDMVVMGTIGNSGLREKIWGSNTAAQLEEATVPLLIIPEDYKWAAPKRVLYVTKQFEEESDVLQVLKDLITGFNAHVEVAIFTQEKDGNAIDYVEHGRGVEEYGHTLQQHFNAGQVTSMHLSGKSFSETLEKQIDWMHIDMLIMISHHYSFWKSLFHKSMTKHMSYRTKIPLLVIPGDE